MKNKHFKSITPFLCTVLCIVAFLNVSAFADGGTPEYTPATVPPVTESKVPNPLTPDGQGTLVDDATDEDGKEFYTITTADEHIFYLVIDKQKENDNVYFLNAVTVSDLMALTEQDADAGLSAVPDPEPEPECSCKDKCEAGAVDTSCPVCVLNLKKCEGVAPEPVEEPEEPEQPAEKRAAALSSLFCLPYSLQEARAII